MYLAQIHERSHSLWQLEPHKADFLNNKTRRSNESLTHGGQMIAALSGLRTTCMSLPISTRALRRPGAWSTGRHILIRILVSEQGVSTVGFFSKLCHRGTCCRTGFVVPRTEHRQSRLCSILKGLGFSEWPTGTGFNLKSRLPEPRARESACSLKL